MKTKPPADAPADSASRPTASRRPRWRTLLPLCVLVLIVGPGCVAANPFFRVTAAVGRLLGFTP